MTNTIIEWRYSQPAVDYATIRELESILNVKFPDDYIECAKQNHGGRPSFECLDFGDEKEKIFGGLLALTEGEEADILSETKDSQGYIPEKVIPFGDDPFGNFYCFDYRKGRIPTVVYWNHELAGISEQRCISYVADSFSAFLKLLYKCPDYDDAEE